jgi:hypothetical protein
MVRKTKRKGGMIRGFAKPLGKATFALGESVGKDYLQNKSFKVVKGIYEDPSLVTNPSFITTGIKPATKPKIQYDIENMNPNLYDNFGGRTKRKYKRKKTRKNRK